MTADLADLFAQASSLAALNGLLADAGVGPGWAKPTPSVYPAPRRSFVPARWCGRFGRAALATAARFVDTDQAERRNLICINPHPGNGYATARTLVAAYQLVKAGEVARSHRHTPNALRLVIDAAPGTFTIVNGCRIPMLPGDVLLTPNWHWHGHDNTSSTDALWIDFLDVPLIHLLEPMFFEHGPGSTARASEAQPQQQPQLRFPFCDTRPALLVRPEIRPGEQCLELGPPQMTTIALHLRRLAEGMCLNDPRTTANCVYAVIEGSGVLVADSQTFDWSPSDVLVVPAWCRAQWRCDSSAILLRVTDQPVLAALGLLREDAQH